MTKHRTGRGLLTGLAATGLIAGLLTVSGTALAAGPGQGFFELDASSDLGAGASPRAAITDNTANTIPDDWDRICKNVTITLDVSSAILDQCSSALSDHSVARTFDSETTATGTANNATIFTGGGSKDPLAISGWAWKDASGGLPDKDNLLHAMSARYGSGSTAHIYFAADRFDNSGDSQIGFWFFKSQVGPTGTSPGGFSGAHTAGQVPHDPNNAGDILILSDFTNGGAQPTIRIFEYVGSGGSDGSLNLLGGNATDVRDCKLVSTDDFCASVNNVDGANAPWLFKNKSGQTTFGHGEFYEGGLNLQALGLQNECFSSFLAETRSSQSTTATLKDFVAGPFQDCTSHVVTTPSVAGSTSITTAGTVTVHDTAAVSVGGVTTFTGDLTFHLCGPITGSGNCSTGGTAVGGTTTVTANGNYDSANTTVTSVGKYCWRADYVSHTAGVPNSSDPANTTSQTECFSVTPVTPDLSTDATADPVNLGDSISDVAHLTGTAPAPGSPIIGGSVGADAGGSITFTVYGPDDCTTVAATLGPVAVSGDDDYTSPTFTPTTAGVYHFAASYTGDSPNTNAASATACPDTDEDVTVNPVQPAITTTATAGPLPLGSSLDDVAHLSGTAPQEDGVTPAGGTITFVAYGPANNTTTCSTAVYTSVVDVSGDGDYTASAGDANNDGVPGEPDDVFTPTAAGTYNWIASYSGDAPNTLSVAGICGDANEGSVIVSLQPTLDTAQSFVPNDEAVVSVSTGAGDLAGSVRFRLYDNNTCSGTALYDETFTIADGDGTLSNSNLTWTVDSNNSTSYSVDTNFSWLVEYTSTNGGHTNVTSACDNENSSITIDNGTQANTP